MMRAWLISVLGLLITSPALSLDRPALLDALATGNTTAMTEAVRQIYVDAGVSWYDRLQWRFERFDYTFNYFDPYEDVIVLGAMPGPADIEAYWRNWSRTLTGGRWQGSALFSGPEQAADLARYNQFVIALHEVGHAMTYRYDYEHLERHNYAVNCREYYADRLTMAALQDLAEADPTLARLQADYVALMASMNAAIADKDRYHIESFAALDADCAVIDVAQPTPDTLQPYASAFFERQRLLAGADLPSLAEMVATHLEARRAEFMKDMPYLASGADFALVTLETLGGTVAADTFERGPDAFTIGFDLDGQRHFARLDHDKAAGRMTLGYGARDALEMVVVAAAYDPPVDDLRLVDIVPGSGGFIALVEESRGPRQDFALYEAQKRGAAWSLALLDRLPDMKQARLLRAPDGWYYVLASSDAQRFGFNTGWTSIRFDLKGNVEPGRSYPGLYGVPLALEADGDLITYGYDLLFAFDDQGRFDVLAGNHLEGLKDGTRPEQTELLDPRFAQVLSDGRLLFIDGDTDKGSVVLRQLTYGR
jgi:hypothetical protein